MSETADERRHVLALADMIAADLGTKELLPEHAIRSISQGIRSAVAAQKEKDAKLCENIGKEIVCPEECAAAIRASE